MADRLPSLHRGQVKAAASKDEKDMEEYGLTVIALRNVVGSSPVIHAVLTYREDTGDLKMTGEKASTIALSAFTISAST